LTRGTGPGILPGRKVVTVPRHTAVKRTYNLQKLRDNHRTMLRGILLGMRQKDVAKATGYTPATVANARRCEEGQQLMAALHQQADALTIKAASQISQLQAPAVELMRKVINGDIDAASINLRVKAALAMLDRGGNAPIRRVERRDISTPGVFTKADIQRMKNEATAEAERRGLLVEAEYTEVEGEDDGKGREGCSEGDSLPSGAGESCCTQLSNAAG